MKIEFTKMHGLGNDFIVINNLAGNIHLNTEHIQNLADRHTGIGFDQLLLVEAPKQPQTDFFYRIFNADGSEVAQCGNGARCFARYVYDKHLTNKTEIRIETLAGKMSLHLEESGQVRVNMGIPNFEPATLPFLTEQLANPYTLLLKDQMISFTALSLGNPHAVIPVDNIDKVSVAELGAQFNQHAQFPQGVNVGFMEILDRHNIRLRVYERGAGETLACGSGACAAAVAGQLQDLLDKLVRVRLPKGELTINWQGKDQPVWMTGSAEAVFEGKIDL